MEMYVGYSAALIMQCRLWWAFSGGLLAPVNHWLNEVGIEYVHRERIEEHIVSNNMISKFRLSCLHSTLTCFAVHPVIIGQVPNVLLLKVYQLPYQVPRNPMDGMPLSIRSGYECYAFCFPLPSTSFVPFAFSSAAFLSKAMDIK